MKISQAGLALTKVSEGLRLKAYFDGGMVPTIGYGHTRSVKMGQTITQAQADAFLVEDMADAEALVNRHGGVLPQLAFDALCDFAFNLGGQGFLSRDASPTGLTRALRAKNYAEVPNQLRRWVYDNGIKVQGLVKRRDAECVLWDRGFRSD